jgi:hypothetical protein
MKRLQGVILKLGRKTIHRAASSLLVGGFCFARPSLAWQVAAANCRAFVPMKPRTRHHSMISTTPCTPRRHAWLVLACVCAGATARAYEPVAPLVVPSLIPDVVQPGEPKPEDEQSGFGVVQAEGETPTEGETPAEGDTGVIPGVETTVVPDGAPVDGTELLTPTMEEALMFDDESIEEPVDETTEVPDETLVDEDFAFMPGMTAGGLPSLNDPWLSGFDAMGLEGIPGGLLGGGGPTSQRRNLGFSLSMTGIFDTNPSRGFTGETSQSDFFMLLGGGTAYRSRSSTWTYGAQYSGGYRMYFDQTDLSGSYHNAGASVNYNGGKLKAGFSLGGSYGSGANRNFESVTETIRVNARLNARYEISQKTSLVGEISQSFETTSGGTGQDTENFDAGISGLWKYSQLTEFGPGLRYTLRSQGDGPTRTTVGPTFTVNYKLSRKVSLNSRVGMDFVSLEDEGSQDPSLFTSLGISYRPSPLWDMNLSLVHDNRASYNVAGQFEEVTALRLNYNRRIRRANWNLGVTWESRSVSNDTASSEPDRDYFSIDTSLGMPIFRNTTQAVIFCGYRDERGGNRPWDSFQVGMGLTRSF